MTSPNFITYYPYTTLFKKYLTLFFPRKTSDGRLANVITVGGGGGTFMHMHDFLQPCPVLLFLLGS
jgi:NAD kinase